MSARPLKNDARRFLLLEGSASAHDLQCLTAEQMARHCRVPQIGYRVSPIFAVVPGEAEVPGGQDDYFLGFFVFEDAFKVVGELLAKIPKAQQKGLWFSHGLASVLFFTKKEGEFGQIKTAAKAKLRAYEIWHVTKRRVKVSATHLCAAAKIKGEICCLVETGAVDSETQIVVEELRHCLNTAVVRAAQFLPSSLPCFERLFPAVNDIVGELSRLANSPAGSGDMVCVSSNGVYSDPVLAREKLKRQLVDQLIQINSALSYVISQAYAGVVPILKHECLTRNYSLLGVGTAHNGLAAFTEFCEVIFQQYPVDTVVKKEFKKAPGFPYKFQPGAPRAADEARFNVDFYIKDIERQQSKLNLAYFSGRFGFRETQFTITAPSQVLTHSGTACWSLMTLTHELMHAHVRAILAALFAPLGNSDSVKLFEGLYSQFAAEVGSQNRVPESLLETVRFSILNYCLQKPSIDEAAAKLGSVGKPGAVSADIKLPDAAHLATRLQAFYREVNEIMVHVLDFNYFYDCREETYLMLLWESWAAVPAVMDNVEEYLLRSLLAVGSKYSGNNQARFTQAVDTLAGVMKKLQEKPGCPPLLSHAAGRLTDGVLRKQLKTKFALGLYLVDMVQRCLVSKHVHAALYTDSNRTKSESSYFYALDTGDFRAVEIASPVAFVADLLRRQLEGEVAKLSQEYVAAWLLLVCASAPIERNQYVSP